MKLARLVLATTLLAVSAPALAEDPAPSVAPAASQALGEEVKAIVEAVEKKYAKVDSIEASFTQVKKDAFGQIQQDGDVVLRRPTKMRWRFTTGDQSEFVTDGSTLWIYTKADNQVLRIQDTSQATSTANAFLTSLDSLDETFTIRLVDNSDGPTLDLTPRKQGMYKTIRLQLTADLVLKKVVFTDAYDNVTDIGFRNVVLNGNVSDDLFVFKVPDGATVIDN